MTNKDLPKLLRTVAGSKFAKEFELDIIFNAAADELEQLRVVLKDAIKSLDKLECDDIQAEVVWPLRDRLREVMGEAP